MTIRERIENNEKNILSDKACLTVNTKGRNMSDHEKLMQNQAVFQLSATKTDKLYHFLTNY